MGEKWVIKRHAGPPQLRRSHFSTPGVEKKFPKTTDINMFLMSKPFRVLKNTPSFHDARADLCSWINLASLFMPRWSSSQLHFPFLLHPLIQQWSTRKAWTPCRKIQKATPTRPFHIALCSEHISPRLKRCNPCWQGVAIKTAFII